MGCLKLTYYQENQPLLKCVWRKPKPEKSVQWFYTVDPLAEKYAPYSPFNYCVNNPIRISDPNGEGAWDRVVGAAQVIGGAAEMLVGGALIVTPEPTMLTKAGGIIAVVHGADNISTGFKQLWTGESQTTLTHQSTKAIAKAAGASDATANTIGTGFDMGAGLFSGGVAVSEVLGSQLPKSVGRIVTSGITHGSESHWATATRVAKTLAGKGENVYLNKSINTALGTTIEGVGNWRPDVLSIGKNGVLNLTEIISPSQTAKEILSKVSTMKDALVKAGYKVNTSVLTEAGTAVK